LVVVLVWFTVLLVAVLLEPEATFVRFVLGSLSVFVAASELLLDRTLDAVADSPLVLNLGSTSLPYFLLEFLLERALVYP
jgi:hypothetical protein